MIEFPPNPDSKRVRGRPKGSKNVKKIVVENVRSVKRKRLDSSTALLPASVLSTDPYSFSFAGDLNTTDWTENTVIKEPSVSYSLISPEERIQQINHMCSSSTSIPMICNSEAFLDDPAGNNAMESMNESLLNDADVPSCIKIEMTDMETGFCYNEQFLPTSQVSPEFNKFVQETCDDMEVCFENFSNGMKTEPNPPEESANNSITSITNTIRSNKEESYLIDNVSCDGKRKKIKIEHMSPEHLSTDSIIVLEQPDEDNCSHNTSDSFEQIREKIKSEPISPGHSSTHSIIPVTQSNKDTCSLYINDNFEQIKEKIKGEPISPGRSIHSTSAEIAFNSKENELNNLPNQTSQNQSKESHSTTAEIAIYSVSNKVNHGQYFKPISCKTEPNSPEESANHSITSIANTIQSNKEESYLIDNVSCDGKRKRIKIEHMSPEHSSNDSVIILEQPNKDKCSPYTNDSFEQIREKIKSEPIPPGHSSTHSTIPVTQSNKGTCSTTAEIAMYSVSSKANSGQYFKSKSSSRSNMFSNYVSEEFSTHSAAYLLMKVDFTQSDILECLDVLSRKYPYQNSMEIFYDEEMEQSEESEPSILDTDKNQISFNTSANVYTEKRIEAEYTTGCTHSQELSLNTTFSKIKTEVQIDEPVPQAYDDKNQTSLNSSIDVDIERRIKAEYATDCTLSQKLSSNPTDIKVKTEVQINEPVPRVLDDNKNQTSLNSSIDVDIEKRIDTEYATSCTLNQKLSPNLIHPKIKTEVKIDESEAQVLNDDEKQTSSLISSVEINIEKRIDAENATGSTLGQKLFPNFTVKTEESSMANKNFLNDGTAFLDVELHETVNNAPAVKTLTDVTNKIPGVTSKSENSLAVQSYNASSVQDTSEISNDLSNASAFSCTSSEVRNMSETHISCQNSKQSSIQKLSVAEYLQRSVRKHVISPVSAHTTSIYAGGGNIVCSKDLFRNIFPDRRGNESVLARGLYRNIGRKFVSSNNMYFLIIEWNSEWLRIQKDTNLCPPICEQYHVVKDAYESFEEYYNTFFPLHLLSIWLEIYDSWNQNAGTISVKFESYEEKSHFVKVVCSNIMPNNNLSPCEGIYMIGSKDDRNDDVDELFGYVAAVQTREFPSSWKKVTILCYTAEKPNIGVNERISIQKLCNIRVALLQNDALQTLNTSTRSEIILNPKAHASKIQLIALPPVLDTAVMREGAKKILGYAMCSNNNITIVDTPQSAMRRLTILKLIEGIVERRFPVLVCFKTKEMLFELAKYLQIRSLILAIKKSDVEVPDEFQQFLLPARAKELKITEGEVLKRCKMIFTLLSGFYLSNSGSVFENSNLACIIDDANLCSETETSLPLSYNPKYVVLLGSSTIQAEMHPRLQAYGYQQSLYSRLYKAKYEYSKASAPIV